jgi:hypothetical protein
LKFCLGCDTILCNFKIQFSAISNEVADEGGAHRITLEEHFNRCRKKYKRHVKKEQFDYYYEILSESFKYVDEVDE